MEVVINTSLGTYKREVRTHKDIVELVKHLDRITYEDNEFQERN